MAKYKRIKANKDNQYFIGEILHINPVNKAPYKAKVVEYLKGSYILKVIEDNEKVGV